MQQGSDGMWYGVMSGEGNATGDPGGMSG